MKFNIGLIIVIVILGVYTIRSIYKIRVSIKNQEFETKYGKNKSRIDSTEEVIDLTKEKYERVRKRKTYSKRKTLEINDEKYLIAKKYAKRIKITSFSGWIATLIVLIVYYIKNIR